MMNNHNEKRIYSDQSCKSGRVFRVGFGIQVYKNFGLNIWARDVLFVLDAQKYNQNNLATLLNFLDLT